MIVPFKEFCICWYKRILVLALFVLSLFSVLILASISAQAETKMQKAFGTKTLVHRIKSADLKAGVSNTPSDNAQLPTAAVSDGKDLILGLDQEGVHLYLISGGTRIDYAPGIPARTRPTKVIEKGPFLRIRSNAGEDLSESFDRAIFNRGNKCGIVCNSGVVSFLSKGMGLKLPLKLHESFLAHHIFRSLIRNGIKDSSGRPMTVEVFVAGDRPTWTFEIYGTLVTSIVTSFPLCVGIMAAFSKLLEH